MRIAMTAVERGVAGGTLLEVSGEYRLDTDEPEIDFGRRTGHINSDLTIGADLAAAAKLASNNGLACNGMMLAGRGFVLDAAEAELFLARNEHSTELIKPYVNGGELVGRPRRRYVIDAFGVTDAELRGDYPHLYQHLLATVKPERVRNRRKAFRDRWWVFGEPRRTFRPAAT